jgi:hypothetical protein
VFIFAGFLLDLHSLGAPHFPDNNNRYDYVMEASISSGSDGFGPTSSNTILSYLAKSTCDTIQPSGSGPTNSPPRPSSPTAPRSSPVSAPTSTKSLDGCQLSPEVNAPNCVSVGNISPGFACYSLSQILPPACTKKNIRWVLTTCNGIALSASQTIQDSNSTTGALLEESGRRQLQSKSFIAASSATCKPSCIRSTRNRICLRVPPIVNAAEQQQPPQRHVLKFKAVDAVTGRVIDGSPTLERIFPIQQKNTNGNCRPANLKCLVN